MIVAIDPGTKGGVAWLDRGQSNACKLTTVADFRDLIESFIHMNPVAVIEDVGYHILGNNAVASAKFAAHCGELRGVLVGLSIPYTTVKPVQWQRAIPNWPGRPKRKEHPEESYKKLLAGHKRKCKLRVKDEMQRRYPHLKVTDATADALGILTWAMERQGKGTGDGTDSERVREGVE